MRKSSFAFKYARGAVGAMALVIGLSASQPVFAQSAACVNLLVGAGYAAWMGVKFGDHYYWSDSFPIGQHRCIALPVPGMVDGAPYSVVVSAVLGSSKVKCTPEPSPFNSSVKNSITYNAWGTTLNVHCEMPSLKAGAANDASAASTPEGLKALEEWKKTGPLPAPK